MCIFPGASVASRRCSWEERRWTELPTDSEVTREKKSGVEYPLCLKSLENTQNLIRIIAYE